MGELVPFKGASGKQRFANIELVQGLLNDFLEGEKVRNGTHRGYAIVDKAGKVLRLIAVEKNEILAPGTVEELISHYGTEGNPAICIADPDPEIVYHYQHELVITLES